MLFFFLLSIHCYYDDFIHLRIIKPTAKRDKLTAIEAEIRKEWKEAHLYESNAQDGTPHYFVTFPYPYMNGLFEFACTHC